MSNKQRSNWGTDNGRDDLDISREELDSVAQALKDDNFKKLFFEYCEEVQAPENMRRYEEEICQLEAERGVKVTFINPQPGFVVKTSIDGTTKGFINIAQNDGVQKPHSEVRRCPQTGKPGLSWSVPFAQSPPRRDLDKQGCLCYVYDVVFHPDALHLAEKNSQFRQLLIDTACDSVEREFKVRLDRANLKLPNLKFKGISRPTVIRKMSEDHVPDDQEPSPIDAIYPPLPKSTEDSAPKTYLYTAASKTEMSPEYATPNFVIKHRRPVDMSEMTYELDSRLNLTIPKELVVEIELPLLTSTSDCTLDVTDRKLFLTSEKPAKYKLLIDLPFPVNDVDGSAKFDRSTRKLVIVLPVRAEREAKLKDLYREDSGVESDIREENNGSSSPEHQLVQEISSETFETTQYQKENVLGKEENNMRKDSSQENFLLDSVHYNFPPHFDCNTLEENLAFTLHVKNVDSKSIEYNSGKDFVHLKFTSLGSGHYPTHYGFFVDLPQESGARIDSVEAEAWDNNVILTLTLHACENLKTYRAGLTRNETTEHHITEEFAVTQKKFALAPTKEKLKISVKSQSSDQLEIEVKTKPPTSDSQPEMEETGAESSTHSVDDGKKSSANSKKQQKKKNNKHRSYSESYCDNLKSSLEIECDDVNGNGKFSSRDQSMSSANGEACKDNLADKSSSTTATTQRTPINPVQLMKARSLSETRSEDSVGSTASGNYKSILKRPSHYGRSNSESCSSIDDHSYSCSANLYDDIIPEVASSDQSHGLSESCKKTVRFSDVIRQQIFRLNSSILGQRKKNQKRKAHKQRALQRRNSEGDSADYDHKSGDDDVPGGILLKNNRNQFKLQQHDSGLDLSTDSTNDTTNNGCESPQLSHHNHQHYHQLKNKKNPSLSVEENEYKNSLMFDLEM